MPDYPALIAQGKYEEAAKSLDSALGKSEDPQLYYYRALVSHKLRNYEYAYEMLEHALLMRKDPDYLKLKGIMLLENFAFPEALTYLQASLELRKDAECFFLAAVCLMFMDDWRSKEYLARAYNQDKARTKLLVSGFYDKFFRNNRFIGERERRALEERIAAMG